MERQGYTHRQREIWREKVIRIDRERERFRGESCSYRQREIWRERERHTVRHLREKETEVFRGRKCLTKAEKDLKGEKDRERHIQRDRKKQKER